VQVSATMTAVGGVFSLLVGCAYPGPPGAQISAPRPPTLPPSALAPSTRPGPPPAPAIAPPPPAPTAADARPPPPERHGFHDPMPDATLPPSAPAMRIANLSPSQCRAEAKTRKLAVARSKQPAKGVATPMRFSGSMHGVQLVTHRAPSPFGVMDCRLALTFDELAQVLAEHGVVQMRIDNMHRPGARLPGKRKRSQHSYGLAIDIMSLTLADGRTLSVEDHWHAAIGETPCGPDAVMHEPSDESITLRGIVCAIGRKGLFHHMLTPSTNAAHRNHFHFDIKRDAKRRSLR